MMKSGLTSGTVGASKGRGYQGIEDQVKNWKSLEPGRVTLVFFARQNHWKPSEDFQGFDAFDARVVRIEDSDRLMARRVLEAISVLEGRTTSTFPLRTEYRPRTTGEKWLFD